MAAVGVGRLQVRVTAGRLVLRRRDVDTTHSAMAHAAAATRPRTLAHRPHTHTAGVQYSGVIAKFHYTGPTGPARTFLRPGSPRNSAGSVRVSDKVCAGPRGSGRIRSGPCSGI